MEYEQIDDYHSRSKIHGGWIVKYETAYYQFNDARGYDEEIPIVSVTFVPDPNHEWRL